MTDTLEKSNDKSIELFVFPKCRSECVHFNDTCANTKTQSNLLEVPVHGQSPTSNKHAIY